MAAVVVVVMVVAAAVIAATAGAANAVTAGSPGILSVHEAGPLSPAFLFLAAGAAGRKQPCKETRDTIRVFIGSNLAKASPGMLHDLQRFAPHLYQRIDDLRSQIVPSVFGRLIRDGLAEGKVRPEIDPDFTVEFWLQAIRGLMHPTVLERTQLTPRQTLERGMHLFFFGLLSPAGRKDYDKHLSLCEKHHRA
jgi:hypothetical protein